MKPKEANPDVRKNPSPASQNLSGDVPLHAGRQNPYTAFLLSLGSQASRDTMRSVLRSIAVMLRGTTPETMAWETLRREDAQQILTTLQEQGRSNATQALYLSALRGVLREAWHQQLIDADTLKRITDLKPYRGKRLPKGRAVPADELEYLLRHTSSDSRPLAVRDAAIIHTLYATGMRRSELVNADFADLVPEDGGIRIIGKGNRERLVYLDDPAWAALNNWIDEVRGEAAGPLFFPMSKNGKIRRKRMSSQAVAFLIQRRVQAAGTDTTLPHDLRRTFITHLLDNQEDLATVADLAGHASIETTRLYDRRGEERKKAAVSRLRRRKREAG